MYDEIELWRGTANAWECDHLGHLNTRFYLARVEQALPVLLAQVAAQGGQGFAITAQHMRFHNEVSAGAALHATGRALGWNESGGEAAIVLHHSATDAIAATFVLRFGAGLRDEQRAAAPEMARERGLAMADLAAISASTSRADTIGLPRTGLAVVMPENCDMHGRWRLSAAMGLVADAVPHLQHGRWRDLLAEETSGGAAVRMGNVLLEFGFVHHRWPQAGDRVEVRSAPSTCTDRVTRTAHWLLDPETGQPWATVSTVGLPLDLDTRRPIRLSEAARAAFRATAVAEA